MKKIILDFNRTASVQEVLGYLADQFGFTENWGWNLDALYDEMTSMPGPVAIGFFMPTPELDDVDIDLIIYLGRVREVLLDAEKANPGIAVIMGDLTDNFDAGDEDPDEYNWQY